LSIRINIIIFKKCLNGIAPNVLVINDVFAVAIKEHEVFQQPQKCGGEKIHKGACADWIFS
jgi:hypothetical protein